MNDNGAAADVKKKHSSAPQAPGCRRPDRTGDPLSGKMLPGHYQHLGWVHRPPDCSVAGQDSFCAGRGRGSNCGMIGLVSVYAEMAIRLAATGGVLTPGAVWVGDASAEGESWARSDLTKAGTGGRASTSGNTTRLMKRDSTLIQVPARLLRQSLRVAFLSLSTLQPCALAVRCGSFR